MNKVYKIIIFVVGIFILYYVGNLIILSELIVDLKLYLFFYFIIVYIRNKYE